MAGKEVAIMSDIAKNIKKLRQKKKDRKSTRLNSSHMA